MSILFSRWLNHFLRQVLTAMVYMDLEGLLQRDQGIDFAVHLGGILFAV